MSLPYLQLQIALAASAAAVLIVLAIVWWVSQHRREPLAPDWTAEELAEVQHPSADPLDTTVEIPAIDLLPPVIADDLHLVHPVRLDWAPPTWSQTWRVAGERAAELGDTQAMPVVEVRGELAEASA